MEHFSPVVIIMHCLRCSDVGLPPQQRGALAHAVRGRGRHQAGAGGGGGAGGRGEGEAGVGVVAAVGLALAGHLAGARAVQLQLKHKYGVIWPAQCRQGPTILCWPSWVPGLVRGEARGC